MKVAVVGAGVSGLSATWALNEYSAHEVHLFEPGSYVGGHTNTVPFTTPSGLSTPVDTGFIVFNKVTYPNFLRFLRLTGVEILDSDMSFSVTRHAGGYGAFEWAGGSPAQLFAQSTNILNPSHWRMVWDILRFNQQSIDFLRSAKTQTKETSIGDWLSERGYSDAFRRNYLIPMTASIWSTAPETALASFPAVTLLRFMHNHHLLQVLDRPQWLTIKGGSKTYVERILSKLPAGRIHQGNQNGTVVAAWQTSTDRRWSLRLASGEQSTGWDKVIFACHADTTVDILEQGRDAQLHSKQTDQGMAHAVEVQHQAQVTAVLDVLKQFQFSENTAVLHSDVRLMPVRRVAWSAWNFLAETVKPSGKREAAVAAGDVDRVSLTYWMNLLQSLPEDKFGPILVTLNPSTDPASPYTPQNDKVVKRQSYTHPIYTAATVAAQQKLKAFQGKHGAYFAGAWTNYGFHEDGFSSGLRAANDIPETYLPFDIKHAERALPASQLLTARLVGTADALARTWIVRTPLHLALVFVIYTIAILQLMLRISGLAPKKLVQSIDTVQQHLRESARPSQPRRIKAA